MDVIDGHIQVIETRHTRVKGHLADKLFIKQAEKKALDKHNLQKGTNYDDLMKQAHPRRDRHLKSTTQDMLIKLDPSYRRKQILEEQLDSTRHKTECFIERNLRSIDSPQTRRRKAQQRILARMNTNTSLSKQNTNISITGISQRAVLSTQHGFVTKPFYANKAM